MEAFGTFFDCIARVTADDNPHAARERLLMHFLCSVFPLARQMTSVAEVIQCAKELQVTPAYTGSAALRVLCVRARSVASRMPPWEEVANSPMRFAKLIKSLVLSFVVYHSARHLERSYCLHTLGQLAADVLMRPVAIFWCHYQRVSQTPPTYAITPTNGGVYFSRDNAVLLCCQRDVVVLVRSREAPLCETLYDDLRFLRDTEDGSVSFEYCPMYALYETTGERVQFVCDFDGEEAELPRAPDPSCFYYLYPAAPECTQLPALAPGTALYVYDDCDRLLATISEADTYAYFRLDPSTKRVFVRSSGRT